MLLSEKIMSLRKRNGWSQEELAQQLGVSRQSVSKWESMASIPDIQKIMAMSDLFGVSTDYLLKDEMEDLPATATSLDSAESSSESATPESSPQKLKSLWTEQRNIWIPLQRRLVQQPLPLCSLS